MSFASVGKELLDDAATIENDLAKFPNMKLSYGVSNRDSQIMTWRVPNGSLVQMYINPEDFTISESKQITQNRTKGGFIVQYWGDNLTKLMLKGTTGSSGVKGINVLRDIYHAELRAFDLVAASQQSQLNNILANTDLSGQNVGDQLQQASQQIINNQQFILRPTLGSLALGVTLYYQGASYKGFFTEFSVSESVSKLGLFDYTMSFTATSIAGRRDNFMAWHREPLADDPTGQLINSFMGAADNAVRSFAGLTPQQSGPTEFHPENAPLTFGGNSLASEFGVASTGPLPTSTIGK